MLDLAPNGNAKRRGRTTETVEDVLLPSQYLDRLIPSASSLPEHRLRLAVLLDAVGLLWKGRADRKTREALSWVLGESGDDPFSFENVCHVLGIEPTFLARGLIRRMASGKAAPSERPTRWLGVRRRSPPFSGPRRLRPDAERCRAGGTRRPARS
jgi:hypothetical protein